MLKLSPLVEIAGGFAVGFSVLVGVAACGTASVLECQAQALRILPPDPDEIDVGVARELARRIGACERQGDAGLP